MPKVICPCMECENNDMMVCTAERITLSSTIVKTELDQTKELWDCKNYSPKDDRGTQQFPN